MFLHRLGHFFYKNKIPLVPKIMNTLIRLVHNCAIYSETTIGQGTKFGYGGISVVVHKRAVIGDFCVIGTNVTIGGRSKSKGVPIIGSNVYIATGAKILGDISIGSNSVIGANAVVICDVPDNCVVAGVPAKIIKTGVDSKDFY
jgi:serine O-acetyltransferase